MNSDDDEDHDASGGGGGVGEERARKKRKKCWKMKEIKGKKMSIREWRWEVSELMTKTRPRKGKKVGESGRREKGISFIFLKPKLGFLFINLFSSLSSFSHFPLLPFDPLFLHLTIPRGKIPCRTCFPFKEKKGEEERENNRKRERNDNDPRAWNV